MAIFALDPVTALIVIDVRDDLLSLFSHKKATQVISNTTALVNTFRAGHLPVVIVTTVAHPPGRVLGPKPFRADLNASSKLAPVAGEDTLDKWGWGAFANTSLEHRLRSANVTQVVIAGLLTSISVESTAREAYDLSFNVTIPVDAVADASFDAHVGSVVGIFPKLGETGTTKEIVERLA